MGDDNNAVEIFDKSLRIESNLTALVGKGESLRKMQRNEEAIYYFDKALELRVQK